MKLDFKNHIKRRVSFLILLCYTFLIGLNTVHHHHIDLLAENKYSETKVPTASSHIFLYTQNQSCSIYANYASLTLLKFETSSEIIKPFPSIGLSHFRKQPGQIFSVLSDQHSLRAPPLS